MLKAMNENHTNTSIFGTSNENLYYIPSNLHFAASEINLRNEVGGEHILKEVLKPLKNNYDYCIIDTNPYLGMLTINALTACDEVIIPVSPQLWSAMGLTDLLSTIMKIKKKLNPKLNIMGILFTICDTRTNLFKEARSLVEENFGSKINIFKSYIPNTIKVGEANYSSKSIIEYEPNSKAAIAYKSFVFANYIFQ